MNQFRYRMIVILGVVGVSFSAIIVKFSNAPSSVLAFYRMLFSFVLLIPVVWKKERQTIKQIKLPTVIASGMSGVFLAFHFTCYFESLQRTSIASSTLLVDTEVFFIAVVTVLIWKEKIPLQGLAGIILTFAGSVILALTDSGGGTEVLMGDILALTGAFMGSLYTMIGRNQRRKISTTLYTFFVYGAASVTLVVISAIQGVKLTGYDPKNYFYGLLLTIFCTFLGHSVFSWGLKYVPAAFISTAKLGEPVFATIMGIFIFGQFPSGIKVAGGIVILFGIYLYTKVKE